jgi:hypothetical protein
VYGGGLADVLSVAALIVGLAVPAIVAVIIAPALIALDVEDYAAYMFTLYYAVLSDISAPTALLTGAGSVILLYREPLWIFIGLGVPAAASAALLATVRR